MKNNAGWWVDDIISDVEFVNNIQYLIVNGIILVESQLEVKSEPEIFTASGKFSGADFVHRVLGAAYVEYTKGSGGALYFDRAFDTVLGPDLLVYLATDKSTKDFVNIR